MHKIREVLRLKAKARLSDRQIAAAICSARSTVQECLRRAQAARIAWSLPAQCDVNRRPTLTSNWRHWCGTCSAPRKVLLLRT